MEKIESASPGASRKVINVQNLLGLPDSTPNPHLWYKPQTMPAVARALVSDLSALQPAHAAYFQANARRFDASLKPWFAALKEFKALPEHARRDDRAGGGLHARSGRGEEPDAVQPAGGIMNGTDPAPQDVSLQEACSPGQGEGVRLQPAGHRFADPVVPAGRRAHGIPVVGVYETMPTPGYDYQSWMLAEVKALEKAVGEGASTEKL